MSATSIATAWWDPRQSESSAAWQFTHAARPTYVAFAAGVPWQAARSRMQIAPAVAKVPRRGDLPVLPSIT